MVPPAQHYLKDPVEGPEAPTLGGPIRTHSVDIDTLLQEAVRDAKTKVVPQGVLVQGHLGAERGGGPWSSDLCPQLPTAAQIPWGGDPRPAHCPAAHPTTSLPLPHGAPSLSPWQPTLRFTALVTVGKLGKGFLLGSSSVLSLTSRRKSQWGIHGFPPSNTGSSPNLPRASEPSEGFCWFFYIVTYRWRRRLASPLRT